MSEDRKDEVAELRVQLAVLEREKRAWEGTDRERERLSHSLDERVKELGCLYGVSRLFDSLCEDLDAILQRIAELLPESWQYPAVTEGRILFEERSYATPDFRTSPWRLGAPIQLADQPAGFVEVYYQKEMPPAGEGPFLEEERLLIDAVADRIGKEVLRIRAQKQLAVERAVIENKNTALREVLDRVQLEKEEVGVQVQANVERIIMPVLRALEEQSPRDLHEYIALLKRDLEEITAPFAHRIVAEFASLTPTEIQICGMVRRGLSTKEIARLRFISPATVSRHRESIRRKLDLTSKSVNLASYLNSHMA
jgi:DNA-binding CsgD family transcriptional regulator